MKSSCHGLDGTPSSTGRFLFCKTETAFKEDSDRSPLPIGPDDLSEALPDVQYGQAFIDAAIASLASASAFAAMAVRIDNFLDTRAVCAKDDTADIIRDAAQTIETVCHRQNGIWGGMGRDTFGCFLVEKSESLGRVAAQEIQQNLSTLYDATVTIGIAVYPTLNFERSKILMNARKALDHAEICGPGSTVCFDAVSLNISGDRLYQDGDIDGAIKEFQTALRLNPLDVNLHNSLGVCYGVTQSFDKAMHEFKTAAWLDPNEIMAIYNDGLVNMLTGNKVQALACFIEAHRIKNDVFEPAFQAGRLYLEMQKPDEGVSHLEKAVRLRPQSAAAQRYLADGYAALGRQDEAVRAYKQAIKLNPDDAAALSAIGCLFEAQGESTEIATVFCEQSVAISPHNGLFRHRLGYLYLQQNRLEEALKEFETAGQLGHDPSPFIEEIRNRLTAKAS